MSRSEEKFVDLVVLNAMADKATKKDLERAMSLLDDQIRGENPRLFAAIMDSRRKGF